MREGLKTLKIDFSRHFSVFTSVQPRVNTQNLRSKHALASFNIIHRILMVIQFALLRNASLERSFGILKKGLMI